MVALFLIFGGRGLCTPPPSNPASLLTERARLRFVKSRPSCTNDTPIVATDNDVPNDATGEQGRRNLHLVCRQYWLRSSTYPTGKSYGRENRENSRVEEDYLPAPAGARLQEELRL